MGGFRTQEAFHLVRTTSIYSCLKKFPTRAILRLPKERTNWSKLRFGNSHSFRTKSQLSISNMTIAF